MSSQSSESLQYTDGQFPALVERLQEFGFAETEIKSEYEKARYKGVGGVAVFYNSGKLLLQGRQVGDVAAALYGVMHGGGEEFKGRIGSDEVGKGDYFGPMVTCAAFVGAEELEELNRLGIRDSKKLDDLAILDMYAQIRGICMHEVSVMMPEAYNQQHEETKNVAIMLARQHGIVIGRLIERARGEGKDPQMIVIDQFSKSKNRLLDELPTEAIKIGVEQFHKGESDIAVASASIIARAHFLNEWHKMEKEYGFTFPKGATHVIDAGREFVSKFGENELRRVAKVSFKTTQKVLGMGLF